MKLEEIIQSSITDRNVSELPTNRRNIEKRFAKGAFSSVYDKNDYEIIRKNHYPNDNDKGCDWLYIEYLINNPDIMASNPHFPRYYNLKRIKDKDGRIAYSATSERLYSASDLEDDEYKSMMDRYFTTYIPQSAFERINLKFKFLDLLKDKLLIKATKTMFELVKGTKCHLDIHANNIMYRRTSHGTIPVLNDPFYGNSETGDLL